MESPNTTTSEPRPPTRRTAVVGVLVGVIALGAIAAYLRLMLAVTTPPIVPYQLTLPPTPVPTASPTPTVLQRTAPRGALDFPESDSPIVGQTPVRGWAVDAGADHGPGVDRIQLFVDGTYVLDADYGRSRPDIGAMFGPGFEDSGWTASLDLKQQPLGPHQLEARAHSVFSDQDTVYTTRITVAPQPSLPRGAIDSPTSGAMVSGVIEVSGWALDEAADQGIGVDRVDVLVDGTSLAAADTRQTRPDIAAAYGPGFGPAGWRARVDLSSVDPGPHQLQVRVHSTVDDHVTLYSAAIVVDR